MEGYVKTVKDDKINNEKSWLWKELWQDAIPLDLYTAASIGQLEWIKKILTGLVTKGEILNKKNRGGWTPLMYAAYCGHNEVMSYLICEGSDYNMKNNDGKTALMLAAMCGNFKCISSLIEYGVKIDDTDQNNRTALFHSALCGHYNVVQLLLEKKSTVNIVEKSTGLTPLMVAINANHETIVKELLSYGADINCKTYNGESVYSFAAKIGNVKIINLIDMFKNHRQLQNCSIHDGARISKQLVKQKQNSMMNRLLFSKEINSATNLLSASSICSLSSLLEKLDLSKYYHVFEDQDIDLDTFLTLTDKDLKDIGIKLLGPRRKMTTAITRWHENASVVGNPLEHAFTNKLLADKEEQNKKIEELNIQLNQEKDLRKLIETTLATERQALTTTLSKLYYIKEKMSILISQIRAINNGTAFLPPNIIHPSQWHSVSPQGVAIPVDNTIQFINTLALELCSQADRFLHILTEFKTL